MSHFGRSWVLTVRRTRDTLIVTGVEGSGFRPLTSLTTHTGAGVRKPSGKEPAGRCAVAVRLALWGLRRAALGGVDCERCREHRFGWF